MLRFVVAVVSSSCVVFALGASLAHATVKVEPAEVMEIRVATLDAKPDAVHSFTPSLTIKLNVNGPEVAGATKWGAISITEAVDDVGTDLRRKKSLISFGKNDKEFREVDRFGQKDGAKDAFEVDLTLALPARKATAIKSLKGEFQVLAGGEEKVVTLTKLKVMQGKPLDDPTLKAAGVVGTVTKPTGDDQALAIDYTGGTDTIKEVEILDADGKSVSNGRFSSGFGGKQSVNYMLSKPLDDTMTMKIHLVVGQKTVKVPVELKDVKLP